MDIAFYTGQQLDKLAKKYLNKQTKRAWMTDALIMQAMNWFKNKGVSSFTGNIAFSGTSQPQTLDITRQVAQKYVPVV